MVTEGQKYHTSVFFMDSKNEDEMTYMDSSESLKRSVKGFPEVWIFCHLQDFLFHGTIEIGIAFRQFLELGDQFLIEYYSI